MRSLSLFLLAGALAGCSTGPQPIGRSAEAEAQLQSLLAGRVAGQPVSCLRGQRANNMITIDDNTVVFRDGRTVYRNDFRGGTCDQLGRGHYALITRNTTSGLCSGDIAQVADLSSGITVGSCVLGDFVPYTRTSG